MKSHVEDPKGLELDPGDSNSFELRRSAPANSRGDHAGQSDYADPPKGIPDVWVQRRPRSDGYVGRECAVGCGRVRHGHNAAEAVCGSCVTFPRRTQRGKSVFDGSEQHHVQF